MDNKLTVTIDNYLPLRDVVFQTLRQAILHGKLKPGERLMELQLASQLGVSRTPIREAIRMLELEGLVTMIPRKGAKVANITAKDLNDVLEVRCALEELAVELACRKITSMEILSLKNALKEFEVSINGTDISLIAEKDVQFHDIIFNATDNKRLIQLLNHLREQMYRYRIEYLKDFNNHDNLLEEHKIIAKNIEEKNIIAAKATIKHHIYHQVMSVAQKIKT